MTTRIAIGTLAALLIAAPVAAGSSMVTRHQAVRVTKRAASRQAARLGLTLPPANWKAACYRAPNGRWRCEAGAGRGYCSASALVTGTRRHPRTRRVRVYCLD
jgi:hypothetical protein